MKLGRKQGRTTLLNRLQSTDNVNYKVTTFPKKEQSLFLLKLTTNKHTTQLFMVDGLQTFYFWSGTEEVREVV